MIDFLELDRYDWPVEFTWPNRYIESGMIRHPYRAHIEDRRDTKG